MANKDNAFGLQPVRKLGGGVCEGIPITIGTTSTYIYKGQILLRNGTNGGVKGNEATDCGALGGTNAAGPVMGVAGEYFDTAGTKTKMMVYNAGEHIFSIQYRYAATDTPLTEASVLGLWFQVTSPHDGNTNSGYSVMELLATGASATAMNNILRCIGVDPRVDNDIALSDPTLLVRFNEAAISEFALA